MPMQKIMCTKQKKKLRYSEETPWFPEYYIGWIGIGNCVQKTSTKYVLYNIVAAKSLAFFNAQVSTVVATRFHHAKASSSMLPSMFTKIL